MRRCGFFLSVLLCAAAPAAGQTPIMSVAQPVVSPEVYGPKTVLPALVACTDVPTSGVSVSSLRVIAPHAGDLHKASVRGELVVLNGGTPQGVTIGQRYFARRAQRPSDRQAISSVSLGAVRTVGWLTVVAADERSALARVDYACTTVEADDYLEPYTEPALPPVASRDGRTNFDDLGLVLFGTNRRELFGAGDLLSIDRGGARGVVNGTRVAFYRDRHDGTPLVEVGLGIVIEVSPDTSKVVVERSSKDVKAGDYFGILAKP